MPNSNYNRGSTPYFLSHQTSLIVTLKGSTNDTQKRESNSDVCTLVPVFSRCLLAIVVERRCRCNILNSTPVLYRSCQLQVCVTKPRRRLNSCYCWGADGHFLRRNCGRTVTYKTLPLLCISRFPLINRKSLCSVLKYASRYHVSTVIA
jgi:hypothetical protein